MSVRFFFILLFICLLLVLLVLLVLLLLFVLFVLLFLLFVLLVLLVLSVFFVLVVVLGLTSGFSPGVVLGRLVPIPWVSCSTTQGMVAGLARRAVGYISAALPSGRAWRVGSLAKLLPSSCPRSPKSS